MRTLDYLNEGYEWVIDLDIEAYFDTVNHDKLISILREHVNGLDNTAFDSQIPAGRNHGKWSCKS